MSLYLGKIHYWLFNKILWFENLEDKVVKLAVENKLNVVKIKIEIENKYGKKLENRNLEEIIDLENIHGWLQNRIHSSEGRLAAWIKVILENNKDSIEKLEKIFEEEGKLAAKEAKKEKYFESAIDLYNSINDYILDGMPCDRVNIIEVSENDKVVWIRRICVHKDIWEKENIDVNVFYSLRNIWTKNFVKELNEKFEYSEEEQKFKIIIKK
ncbi:hypothetical protein NON08_10065 [Cetobacterium somerae]|uniref:hypothetical protein n=1 Tax=Cetobacterium sp. NK01 TaxID=2993530 RepID=UPI0021162489|nr:hypothetical protein [Cetobacterium sp. NK01]MCQ8212864.1 hypothetical protein [Cetobacterium sp. NK01]